jgi:hypothetical protein
VCVPCCTLQAHRFQQDSSWHTGNSRHGESSELPLLLSQQQLEQLQADGPAAAASMIFSDRPQQGQESLYGNGFHAGSSSSATGAALGQQQQQRVSHHSGLPRGPPPAAGASGVGVSSSAATAPHIMSSSKSVVLPTVEIPPRSAAAAGDSRIMLANSGPSRSENSLLASAAAAGPASPSPTALARSASAQFEHDGSTGVYVAAEDGSQGLGAPGRVQQCEPAVLNHFGSAPEVVTQGREGRVHSGRGALAAAAAGECGGLVLIATV